MFNMTTRIGLVGLLGLATVGCTDGYGYSGVGLGYGSAGYYDDGFGYGDPYGGGYGYGGYGYAPSYFGWYNDFYYPGSGIYVYDNNRRRFRWNDTQRRYWEGQRGRYARNPQVRENWQDFRRDYRQERQDYRGDLRTNRQQLRDGTINREQFREGRRDARQEFRRDVRQDYRQARQENREIRRANPGVQRAPGTGRGGGRRR
jgi:hypothetical protein